MSLITALFDRLRFIRPKPKTAVINDSFVVKAKHPDGWFTIDRTDTGSHIGSHIGFWSFKPEDEQQVDTLVKAMNGAFDEGIEYGMKRLGEALLFASAYEFKGRKKP